MVKKITALFMAAALFMATATSVLADEAEQAVSVTDQVEETYDAEDEASEDRVFSDETAGDTAVSDLSLEKPSDEDPEGVIDLENAEDQASETDLSDEAAAEEGASDELLMGEDDLNTLAASNVMDGYYKIGSIQKGYSVDVAGGVANDGTNAQVHKPNGTLAQIFYIGSNRDGTYSILAYGSNKALDVCSSGTAVGTNVQMWSYKSGHKAQKWQILNDNGYCRLVNPNSGKALTVSGTNLQLGPNVGNAQTRFLLTKIDMVSKGIQIADILEPYDYTGAPVEPALDVRTVMKSDIARSETHGDYYITGGLDIPQINSGNYGNTPCGVTATAMVISYLRGVFTSPTEIYNRWPNYRYNLHYLTHAAAAYYGVGPVDTNGPQDSHEVASIDYAMQALAEGRPVIVYQEGLSIFSQTGNSHFIVLRGVTQDGMIMVNDPNGGYPFYPYDPATYEYTLFTREQVAANAKEIYVFSPKSAGAQYSKVIETDLDLPSDSAWTLSYEDNVEPGIGKAIVTGSGQRIVKKFAIVDRDVMIESGKAYYLASLKNPIRGLDVAGGSTTIRANVRNHTRNNTDAQAWYFIRNEDNTWKIKNVRSGFVLDAEGGGVVKGTNVWQYTDNGTSAQKWYIVLEDDGTYRFINAKSRLVLDVAGGSTANDANIQIYKYQTAEQHTPSQRFFAVETDYTPCLEASGYQFEVWTDTEELVLDIPGGSKDKRVVPVLASPGEAKAPLFKLIYRGGDYYSIQNENSGLVLDVAGGYTTSGTAVQQYKWNKSAAQLWKLEYHEEDDTVTFISALADNRVLDLKGGILARGTKVQLYKKQVLPEKIKAQRFHVRPYREELPAAAAYVEADDIL
ncbi:MAG: RICIN domain-containing protein [Lachnospiraceae bacterium]|nr:RICIN domain-containing protein [Lachnospiraceae bacterium]